jgi:hypothetical protein
MGFTRKHASSLPIGLNPGTGAITSQFHVVFDDWFSTVSSTAEQLPDFNSPEWIAIFGDSEYQYPLDHDPVGNIEVAPFDPPLSVDSYDLRDSRYQPDTHRQDHSSQQREPLSTPQSSQQREMARSTAPAPTTTHDDTASQDPNFDQSGRQLTSGPHRTAPAPLL